MTEIKRYNVEVDPQDAPVSLWDVEDGKGQYVYFDDHAEIVAALQEQVREIAAENAALTELYRKSVTDLDGMCFEMGMMRGEKSMEYPAPETPATDAVIREIRAQGVEEFAKHLRGHMQDGSPLGLLSMGADEFAARIRSGEQP